MRAAVQSLEVLAIEVERDRERRGVIATLPGDVGDVRIGEELDVELHRLLGLVIEPQERGHGRHGRETTEWIEPSLRLTAWETTHRTSHESPSSATDMFS